MNSTGLKSFQEELARSVPLKFLPGDPALVKDYAGETGNPAAVVFPGNVEQVKDIVRSAGRHHIPLTPLSSGPTHSRGIAFSSPDTVVVDFSRMNKILKIDEYSRYAWIEAGVTFGELIPVLKEHGLRLNQPLLPRATKSVVTSLLEREPVLIPKYQYDYIDPLLTVEVVYGTGDDFRTGSASGPGPLEQLKADKVNPWGPGSLDYVRFLTGAQGTMGFVTWAVVKTEIIPTLKELRLVAAEDLKTLTNLANRLLRKRVADECLILNNVNLAALLSGGDRRAYDGLMSSLPPWMLMCCISGYDRYPEERVTIQDTYFREICGALGVEPTAKADALPAGYEETILGCLTGCWNESTHWKRRFSSGCRDIFFLSPLSRAPGLYDAMARTAARSGFPAGQLGATIQPQVQGRGCHMEFSLYDNDSGQAARASTDSLFMEASETLMENGAYFSRPYGPWADMVYGRYPEGAAVLKTLKNIFDPQNTLNPGKLCF